MVNVSSVTILMKKLSIHRSSQTTKKEETDTRKIKRGEIQLLDRLVKALRFSSWSDLIKYIIRCLIYKDSLTYAEFL